MQRRTETLGFGVVLAACVTFFFHDVASYGSGAQSRRRLAGRGELSRAGRRRLRAVQSASDGPRSSVPALAGVQQGRDPPGSAAALESLRRLRRASPRQRPERGVRPVPAFDLPRPLARRAGLGRRRSALVRGPGCVPSGSILGHGARRAVVRRAGLSLLRLPGRLVALPGHPGRDLASLDLAGDRPGDPAAERRGCRPARRLRRRRRVRRAHPDQRPCAAGGRLSGRLATGRPRVSAVRALARGAGVDVGDHARAGYRRRPDSAVGGLSLRESRLERATAGASPLVGADEGRGCSNRPVRGFPIFTEVNGAGIPTWRAGWGSTT